LSTFKACLAVVVLSLGVLAGPAFAAIPPEKCPVATEWDPITQECYPIELH
jgi:hypothetical protein